MLSIDILEKKVTAIINGEEIIDLVSQTIDSNYVPNYTRAIITSDEMVMRPDLAASMYCGSHNKLGILLKMNSISNPFSLDSSEVLFIPDSETMRRIVKTPDSGVKEDARKSFRKKLQERISKVSEQRKEYLNSVSISESAQTQPPLPPNVSPDGAEQFKVENGKLIFGSDVGVCRTKIQQNKSVATIKSRFAQRQIFES